MLRVKPCWRNKTANTAPLWHPKDLWSHLSRIEVACDYNNPANAACLYLPVCICRKLCYMHSIRCDKIALNFPRKKMMGQHRQALHRVKLSPLQLSLDHWRLEKLTFEKPQYLLMKHCQNGVAAVAAAKEINSHFNSLIWTKEEN